MPEALTVPAKYVYLDVVNFTHNRSVEAQVDIVSVLNAVVESSLVGHELGDKLILLPTGDGICVALLNVETPYDIHVQVALDIVKRVQAHNDAAENEMRKFQVRIGINANTDNLVTDINGNRNIAGIGISTAQRVMSIADGNQILVGQTVFETLRQREKYMNSFKGFLGTVKHNLQIPVYQLVAQNQMGLNIDVPSALQTPAKAPAKLTRLSAYYFAHAIKNRQFFLSKKDDTDTAGTILLWFLAQDSIERTEATEVDVPSLKTFQAKKGDIEEQYAHYKSIGYPISTELSRFIEREEIPDILEGYYEGQFGDCRFINAKGVEKLQKEWPSIWAEFELDRYILGLAPDTSG